MTKKEKTLQEGDTVRQSLLMLRNELLNRDHVCLNEVIMKINSCLFSQYPVNYTKPKEV